jgi:putative peptide zinc metalloprotease protein
MPESNHSKLPELLPTLQLFETNKDKAGNSQWVIYNPISNQYYKIGRVEYECLSRFQRHKTIHELIEDVNTHTTCKIGDKDIEVLAAFLSKNYLIKQPEIKSTETNKKHGFFQNLLHRYLFFSIPLIYPQRFLDTTYFYIRPLFTKIFFRIMLLLLALGLLFLLPQIELFIQTASLLTTAEGLFMAAIVFFWLKIIHEFAHAFTATKYNMPIPHMGVAVLVFYPVLYTETTGSWRLKDQIKRMDIGLSGVIAEIYMAILFLWIWLLSPMGSDIQSISFLVITISLIGSLLINLNPLMRFDGYYILSDLTGYENLQSRSCRFAVHTIRKFLLGLQENVPETLNDNQQQFLTWFGFALISYRFFLFMGIAIMLFYLIPQPFGTLLMLAELWLFIGRPVWQELKIWYGQRTKITGNWRGRLSAIFLLFLFICLFIPYQSTHVVDGILHPTQYQTYYTKEKAIIEDIRIDNLDIVSEGQLLMTIKSNDLDYKIKKAEQNVRAMENNLRASSFNTINNIGTNSADQNDLDAAKEELNLLKKLKHDLNIKAAFDGRIKDFDTKLYVGQSINPAQKLFTLVNDETRTVTAYLNDRQRNTIDMSAPSTFIPAASPFQTIELSVKKVADIPVLQPAWASVTNMYGGRIKSERNANGNPAFNAPHYTVEFSLEDNNPINDRIVIGTVHFKTKPQSILSKIINNFQNLILYEGAIN